MNESSYERIEKIGEGTYGIVYKAKNKLTNKIVALKKVRLEHENEGIPPTTIREISLLKALNHPSIIKLDDVLLSNNRLYLVFEYIETDLRVFLDEHKNLDEYLKPSIIFSLTFQLITALNVCHSRGIIHRDIKPQNILLQKTRRGYILKLADFGLARFFSIPIRTYSHEIVTLWYRCPEIILGSKYYSYTVDMWSLGCIIYELVHMKPLFAGDSEIDQLYKIFRILGTPDNQAWINVENLPNYKAEFPKWKGSDPKDLVDGSLGEIIGKCLVYEPLERSCAKELLKHECFRDFEKFYEKN